MFCGNVLCKFVTLLGLAWDGTPVPVAVVFLAISARALRIFDVSAAGPEAAALPFAWFRGMKSLGGVIVGVVERGSTDKRKHQKPYYIIFLHSKATMTDGKVLPFKVGVVSFCLKPESIALGNVLPRSQISTSFKSLA